VAVRFLFFFFQAEDGIRDGHVTGVQTCALPIFVNWCMMASEQRVLEMNVHAAVAVFYVENDRVPADLTPAPDDAQSAIACRHDSGQIHCPDFEVTRHWDRFLHDWRVQNPWNNYLLPGF